MELPAGVRLSKAQLLRAESDLPFSQSGRFGWWLFKDMAKRVSDKYPEPRRTPYLAWRSDINGQFPRQLPFYTIWHLPCGHIKH